MSERLHRAYGSNDPSTLFGDSPATVAPWPPAGRRKSQKDYEKSKVEAAVLNPDQYRAKVDPRELHATQPSITRAGVAHYLEHGTTGPLYADSHQAGNREPVVYDREGTKLLLSGHHRAASALLRGEQFDAVVVKGSWGEPRQKGR